MLNARSDSEESIAESTKKNMTTVRRLGRVKYAEAWRVQRALAARRHAEPGVHGDDLLLLQHPSTYTLGRKSTLDNVKFDVRDASAMLEFDVHRTERGGEVTHHAPGQLVGYPIFDLRNPPLRKDLHWYLRCVEEVVIRVLSTYGLHGERIDGLTGVWVDGRKIAAVGLSVSRWVTMHGFALNVTTDLAGFDAIVPCGIADRRVASLAEFVPGVRLDEDVEARTVAAVEEVFGITTARGSGGYAELAAELREYAQRDSYVELPLELPVKKKAKAELSAATQKRRTGERRRAG